MGKSINLRANIAFGLIFASLVNSFGPLPLAQAQDFLLPAPGVMVPLSPEFNPPILKGIKVHPENPFKFDFILDRGDSQLSNDALKDESSKLIKYFLASLTTPEKDLWVNLSPYEKDRIVPESFGQTEMGRDLLAEDYMLKQITASLIYPEGETGKKFWKRIYEEAAKKFGTTNIPVNTFNKVWIVPEKAVVYENAKTGAAYVVESKLKVMLEQDYLSLAKHEGIQSSQAQVKGTSQLGSQVVREIVIPELTKEINEDKNFAPLRQVYNSLILATWYKKKIKDSILAQVYTDKNKVTGINIDDPQEKQKIYERYLQAFKKGVYNYIKEDIDPLSQQMVPRKYFSGGEIFAWTDKAMSIEDQISPERLGNRDNLYDISSQVDETTETAGDGAMTMAEEDERLADGTRSISHNAKILSVAIWSDIRQHVEVMELSLDQKRRREISKIVDKHETEVLALHSVIGEQQENPSLKFQKEYQERVLLSMQRTIKALKAVEFDVNKYFEEHPELRSKVIREDENAFFDFEKQIKLHVSQITGRIDRINGERGNELIQIADLRSELEELFPSQRTQLTRVRFNITPDIEDQVIRGSKWNMICAVYNLINNSLEADRSGNRVDVNISRTPKGEALIEVRDQGPGIPQNLLEYDDSGRLKIFDPNATTKGNGTGLGTNDAWYFAKDMGGEISVKNIIKQGSVKGASFIIKFPLDRAMKTGVEIEGATTYPFIVSPNTRRGDLYIVSIEAAEFFYAYFIQKHELWEGSGLEPKFISDLGDFLLKDKIDGGVLRFSHSIMNSIDAIYSRAKVLGGEYEGRITLRIVRKVQGYTIEVADNGTGMTRHVLATHILYSGSTKKPEDGYLGREGIGSLSIAKGFVNKYAGVFQVDTFSLQNGAWELTCQYGRDGQQIDKMVTGGGLQSPGTVVRWIIPYNQAVFPVHVAAPVQLAGGDRAMKGDLKPVHLKSVNKLDTGGIDLTPANKILQTQNAGVAIKFHLNPAQLAQLQNAPGFTVGSITIQPLKSLSTFLGLPDNQSIHQVASL